MVNRPLDLQIDWNAVFGTMIVITFVIALGRVCIRMLDEPGEKLLPQTLRKLRFATTPLEVDRDTFARWVEEGKIQLLQAGGYYRDGRKPTLAVLDDKIYAVVRYGPNIKLLSVRWEDLAEETVREAEEHGVKIAGVAMLAQVKRKEIAPYRVTVECPICGEIIEVREYDAISRTEALKRHIKEKHSGKLLSQTTGIYTDIAVFCGEVKGRSAVAVKRVGDKVVKVAGMWLDEGAWERHAREMERLKLKFVGFVAIDPAKPPLEMLRVAMDKLCPQHDLLPQALLIEGGKNTWLARLGDCYTLAWRYIMKEKEGWLVHGRVFAGTPLHWIEHAWVELPTGVIYEPVADAFYKKDTFYQAYRAKELKRYTVAEAAKLAAKFGHYGPWTSESSLLPATEGVTILFNIPEARQHLISKGWVYTLRPTLRKTGKDVAWHGSYFKKERIGDVWIDFIKEVKDVKELEPYVYGSGFDKVQDWWMVAKGSTFLFKVRLLPTEERGTLPWSES